MNTMSTELILQEPEERMRSQGCLWESMLLGRFVSILGCCVVGLGEPYLDPKSMQHHRNCWLCFYVLGSSFSYFWGHVDLHTS